MISWQFFGLIFLQNNNKEVLIHNVVHMHFHTLKTLHFDSNTS